MDIRRYFIIGVVILLMAPVAGCSRVLMPREVVAKACATTSKVEFAIIYLTQVTGVVK